MTFQQISRRFLVLIAAITFFFSGISSALAADTYNYQNNQDLNQPATLTAPSNDDPIEIYPQPDSSKPSLGKAQKGDLVTVVQQIEGNLGKQWDYVKFEKEDQKEGWILQDYVAIQTQRLNQEDQKPAQQIQERSSSSDFQQEDYPNTQQSSRYQNQQKQSYSQTQQDYEKYQSYQRNSYQRNQ